MPTPNNNLEVFDNQNDIFPSFSASNVKTTNFDFFYNNDEIFENLLQPATTESPIAQIKRKKRIYLVN